MHISKSRKVKIFRDWRTIGNREEEEKGQKGLLGEEIDEKLQLYLIAVWNNRGGVSVHLAMTAAKGFMLAALTQYGECVNIKRHWAPLKANIQ